MDCKLMSDDDEDEEFLDVRTLQLLNKKTKNKKSSELEQQHT